MPYRIGAIASGAVEDGIYTVRIDEIEAGESKNKNPKLTFKATIIGGEKDGKKLFWSRTYTDNAIWKLGNDLQNCGFASNRELPDTVGEAAVMLESELRGSPLMADVVMTEYQGRKGNDVTLLGYANSYA